MSLRIMDRAQQTTTSTGTGALLLNGSVPGSFTFAGVGLADGQTFPGLIEHATADEVELTLCTFHTGSPPYITRAALPDQSTTGTKIDFSAGIKTVSCVLTRRLLAGLKTNPLLHGAVGDGVIDDSAAMQAAIDATPSGGTLDLLEGFDFYCASNLSRDGTPICIRGSGLGSKITFGASAGLIVNATTGTDSFCLENCTLRSPAGTTNKLVTLSRINSQGGIRNVYFEGGGTHVWYERSVYNVALSGCTLYAAQVVALNMVPTVASTINGNGVDNCFFAGNKRHVEISNFLLAIGFRQCIFQRNSVIAGVQSGVYVHGGIWDVMFDGCGFEDVNAIACLEFGNVRYPAIRSGYFSLNGADAVAVDCSGSDGTCTGLSMEQFSITATNANNPLINLRSYGVRPRIRGVLFSGGTVAKGIAGSVPARDVYLDVTYDGTFTVKSDYRGRTSELTAWWFGTGADPTVSSAAFNMTVAWSATGIYVVSFGTDMDNVAYVPVVSVRVAGNKSEIRVQTTPALGVGGFTFDVIDGSGSYIDASEMQIHVAGGLD